MHKANRKELTLADSKNILLEGLLYLKDICEKKALLA